jgi:predicted nucleic acid-binding protein
MASILLDTNILVYTFEPRDVVRQEKAIEIILQLEQNGAGCLSTQCLAEFVNAVVGKRILSINEAIIQVEHWINAFPIHALTPQIVLEAARGVRDHQLSYYEAQIWASAHLNQVVVVFSEDFQDGQMIEGVRFINPFNPVFQLEEWL